MAVSLSLANVYEGTNNPKYLPWLDSRVEWAYHDLERTRFGGMQHITYIEENGNYGNDTLVMTVLPLATIGKVLNRPDYIEEIKKHFLIHIKYLFDTKTGLFFHDFYFNDVGHNFARALLDRGNARLATAVPGFPDILSLSSSDPLASHLLDTFNAPFFVSEESTARTRFLDDASAIFPFIFFYLPFHL